jgi:hypothetical protein
MIAVCDRPGSCPCAWPTYPSTYVSFNLDSWDQSEHHQAGPRHLTLTFGSFASPGKERAAAPLDALRSEESKP